MHKKVMIIQFVSGFITPHIQIYSAVFYACLHL